MISLYKKPEKKLNKMYVLSLNHTVYILHIYFQANAAIITLLRLVH